MTSPIVDAMSAIHHLSAYGNCRHAPEVSISFANDHDRFLFKQALKASTPPVTALEITKGFSMPDDEYTVHGLNLKLIVKESR